MRSPPVRPLFLRSAIIAATVSALGATLLAGSPAGAASSTPAPSVSAAPEAPGIGDPGGPLPPDAGSEVLPPFQLPTPRAPGSQLPAAPTVVPPTPSGLPSSVEPLSPYLGQRSCDFREKPGVRAFADLLLRTYPGTASAGIRRSCLVGGTSEHKEGRAFDWWVSVDNPVQVAQVNELINWLLATDAAGNRHAMARRLGLMYLIWDSKSWSTYRSEEGWRPYSCSGTTGCHRDHVHFSFGWAGAWQRTSYWTRQVAPVDYGPCVPSGQRNAPVYSRFNATPCPSVATPPAPANDLQFLQQNLNLVATSGDSGTAVSVIQRQVGTTVTGAYGSDTVAAVRAYQQAYRLPVTGWVGTATWRTFVAVALRALARRVGDYNGDSRTDLAVFRPSNGTWYVRGIAAMQWGVRGDRPVPADYSGDGRVEPGVYRPSTGTWWVRGGATTRWGVSSDIPVPADYIGDGRADLAVFRPATGTWWVRGATAIRWGVSGDIPVPGDYNGDGRAELAVYRPSTGTWWVRGVGTAAWGLRGDVPVPADYNGDGRVEVAAFRPSTGSWHPRGAVATQWGARGDVPSSGDYDGSSRADLAVFRPATGAWWVRGAAAAAWGRSGDVPLVLPYAIARTVVSFG